MNLCHVQTLVLNQGAGLKTMWMKCGGQSCDEAAYTLNMYIRKFDACQNNVHIELVMKGYAFEWDEAKRRRNQRKHGLDFAQVVDLDWELGITSEQRKGDEVRFLTYAPIRSRLYAIVWTKRADTMRVISFRKANKREVNRYG